ncbi:MAG: hypothetical protein LH472_08810 [Pyrinomonadaceae bacterium]|nr:hypothetical protein [Pyrinomonadaceae bacterium]
MEKKWLWRSFHVVTADGVFEVIYNGKGAGYEEVLVNGEVVCRLPSHLWYVPKFDFDIGNAPSQINVKVSPLLQIISFRLIVGEMEIYSE